MTAPTATPEAAGSGAAGGAGAAGGSGRVFYIETNFLLTAAKRQDGCEECDTLLAAAAEGRLDVRVPAFCLAEACRTLNGQHQSLNE